MIYLMIPYTWNPPLSYRIANSVAADLMSKGTVVFSPISHSHSIANHMAEKFRTNYEFWMKMDLPILKKCDKVVMVVIGEDGERLIKESKGCQRELREAKKLGLEIEQYVYEHLNILV